MILRSPRLGNTYALDTGVVSFRTIDGTLLQSKHNHSRERMEVTFDALNRDQRDYLESFLEDSIGELLNIVDHEGYTWEGFLVTDNLKIVTEGRGCNYSVSFTFEGNRS